MNKDLKNLESEHNEKPELRIAQKKLAECVITFLHGKEEYDKALKISEALFSGNIKELKLDEIESAFKDIPSFTIAKEYNLIDLIVNNGIASSKREAREFINAGSILINGDKVTDENEIISKDKAIENKAIVIRRGKKKYYMGIFK